MWEGADGACVMATQALAANWFAFGAASPWGKRRQATTSSSLVACANFVHVATFTSDVQGCKGVGG